MNLGYVEMNDFFKRLNEYNKINKSNFDYSMEYKKEEPNKVYSVEEKENNTLIKYIIPGVPKSDIEVSFKRDHVLVEIKKDDGNIKNEFELTGYDLENIGIDLDLGILTLSIPKKIEEKYKRVF